MKTKVAIVYDWIDKWGGVERLLLSLHELFPEADFYTSYYDKENAKWAQSLNIKTSFIQRLPSFIKKNRLLSLLLYPFAFESFDLSEYDTVISVTSSFAKGVITKPQTNHICILLTPTRYLWGQSDEYTKHKVIQIGNAFIGNYLRKWDYLAAQRPDKIVSISTLVAERCKKYYNRDSTVMYPPFDIEYWESLKGMIESTYVKGLPSAPYYLVVSRLEPYKKVDFVIDTFNLRDELLVVVGTGTEETKLKDMARNNIIFLKNLTDEKLAVVYSQAKALIMPQEEDFGYVSLEAQSFGCPVISYARSGAKETVLENKTGVLFHKYSSAALNTIIDKFDIISYGFKQAKKDAVEHMKKFNSARFQTEFLNIIEK